MSPHEPGRLAAVLTDLRDRGYQVPTAIAGEEPVAAAEPSTADGPIVATGGDHPAGGPDAPLSIDRLREVTPLSVVDRVAEAAHAGRSPVLVVDEWGLEDARAILGEPFLLRDRVGDRRQFYSIPDRIPLSDGRYACVRADEAPRWREESPTPASNDDPDRSGTDEPRLLLEADGTIQAVLESAAALTCPRPDPEAFPYRYGRGADKRIHVFDRDGEVGRYAGIAAMRANAYRPVPRPLVPERRVRTGGRLARNAALATVTDDGVEYERPRTPVS